MPLSETKRARYAAIGIDAIRRELATGSVNYIGVTDQERAEAKEWVAERDAETQRQKTAELAIDEKRFQIIRRWTVVAALASTIAAVAGIIALLK